MKYRSATKFLQSSVLASLALLAWSVGIAQNTTAAAPDSLRTLVVVPATQERARAMDQQLQDRVENALRSDPYFYGAHVNVSVENGAVVLQGFVFSDWDLRDAIRIATKAGGGVRVIDNLAIEVGGRR
jgi:osmotically-inducible protein OsmY